MRTFKELRTITGRQIKVRSNKKTRTWTIKVSSGTYRTYPMTNEEFMYSEDRTGNDWQQFLKSNNYYRI